MMVAMVIVITLLTFFAKMREMSGNAASGI